MKWRWRKFDREIILQKNFEEKSFHSRRPDVYCFRRIKAFSKKAFLSANFFQHNFCEFFFWVHGRSNWQVKETIWQPCSTHQSIEIAKLFNDNSWTQWIIILLSTSVEHKLMWKLTTCNLLAFLLSSFHNLLTHSTLVNFNWIRRAAWPQS